MPPRAALNSLPCVPALDTTKNEHLHTSMTLAQPRDFTVDVSVFRAHLPQSPYRFNSYRHGIVTPQWTK